jgi:hypothetical protein
MLANVIELLATHLARVVHLPRKLGIKEPHNMLQFDAGIPCAPLVELGPGVMQRRVARTDMVVKVVVGRFDVVVAMFIVECSFLWIVSSKASQKAYIRIAQNLV